MFVAVIALYLVALLVALDRAPRLARVLVGLGVTAVVVGGAAFVTLLAALDDHPWG